MAAKLPGWQSSLHCEPPFASQRPAGSYSWALALRFFVVGFLRSLSKNTFSQIRPCLHGGVETSCGEHTLNGRRAGGVWAVSPFWLLAPTE